jgi:tRNA1Val (adenine37-N6)-methyltransferase
MKKNLRKETADDSARSFPLAPMGAPETVAHPPALADESGKRTAVPRDDETLDTLFDGALRIFQSRAGYRFSLDALLLAHFVRIHDAENVADLGTGNGVIPLVLARLHPSLAVTGVELQEKMAGRAAKSVGLNGLQDRIDILRGDVRAIDRIAKPQTYDVVVCNPPYRRPTSGRLSPISEKQIARHEIHATLNDFVRAGVYLLSAKGRMAAIYPAVRAVDLLESMRKSKIEPKRLRMVHSFADSAASLVLVEAVKGGRGGVEVLAPLVIYQQAKQYTAEVAAMISGPQAPVSSFRSRVSG